MTSLLDALSEKYPEEDSQESTWEADPKPDWVQQASESDYIAALETALFSGSASEGQMVALSALAASQAVLTLCQVLLSGLPGSGADENTPEQIDEQEGESG